MDWRCKGYLLVAPHFSRSKGLDEPPDPDFSFVLATGQLYGHSHTQTCTDRIEKIRNMHPEPFMEIHPRDAPTLGIIDNQLAVACRRL